MVYKGLDVLIEKIATDQRCEFYPSVNVLPPLSNEYLNYPTDMVYFYSKCNGLKLFSNSDANIVFFILPVNEILRVNPIVVGEPCEEDISSTWFTIAKTDNNEFISLDLSVERNGRCYDSHYETHGVVGSSPIIALSFTELLKKLYQSEGKHVFWRDDNYGDAYDAENQASPHLML